MWASARRRWCLQVCPVCARCSARVPCVCTVFCACALCVHGVLHVCPVCARCSACMPCVCTVFCMCALCVHGVLHVCPVYTRLAVGLMCNRSPQNGAPMRMARCLAMRFEESAQLPGQHMCKLPWPVLGCQVSRCVGATHLSVTVRSALSDSSRASQLL